MSEEFCTVVASRPGVRRVIKGTVASLKYQRTRRQRNRDAGSCINENLRGTHGPATDGCRCAPCATTHRGSRGSK